MSERLVLLGLILNGASGVPGLFLSRRGSVGQRIATFFSVVGGLLGLAGVGVFWFAGAGQAIVHAWPMIEGAEFNVGIDGLSALFLVPIFLIPSLGAIYGLEYWKQSEHPSNGRKLRLFYGLMTAGMALLVSSRNSILFLAGWEIMAISAYFLVATEDDREEARTASWIYLVATHAATLLLFAMFALLHKVRGSFSIAVLDERTLTPDLATAIFVLALLGFGFKAGIMPLHVWLPGAHAAAPSHVSAIMSGVLIKMGIYGLIRTMSLFPHPPTAWGGIVLGLGAVSGVLGVAFAIGQHDIKRLLAYHSIENIGIIVMGLGIAMLGRSLGQAGDSMVVLGLAGALLHVWNHALFKALLFLSAGSVIHGVHTREIDHLGGLMKRMPRTALCFLVGAVAICGLPPLNGFVSEFLIYLGMFDALNRNAGSLFALSAFAAPALALIGALAAACFVKVFGAVFLGTARSDHARHAAESGPAMIGAMSVLAACCAFIGLAPTLIAPFLGQAVSAWAPEIEDAERRLAESPSLAWISATAVALAVLLFLTSLLLRLRLRRSVVEADSTWGCGYAAPTARMQYTSSSFAQMLVGLFAWALRPRVHQAKCTGLFPKAEEFRSETPDPALDEAALPAFRISASLLSRLRIIQHGNVQAYLLYVFVTLVSLLLWLQWR